MRLGELIAALEDEDPSGRVMVQLPQRHDYPGYGLGIAVWPTSFGSYRGYYDQLALSVSEHAGPISVADLLVEAMAADGATFRGWKGGDYVMNRDTAVWVAERGDATSFGIVGRAYSGEALILVTADVSDYQGW